MFLSASNLSQLSHLCKISHLSDLPSDFFLSFYDLFVMSFLIVSACLSGFRALRWTQQITGSAAILVCLLFELHLGIVTLGNVLKLQTF